MANDWRITTLDQLGRIVTGKTPSSAVVDAFDGDMPFVTPSDMNGARIISTTSRKLSASGQASVKNCIIPKNSILVSCIGSDMGKAAIVNFDCVTNQQINSIIVDTENSPLFVYYNLSLRKAEIRGSAGGSAQPILNKSAFGRLQIELPPIAEQRAIAHILGTLDDKIELNRRANETLEAMARALFKAWFVDFEPVRAKQESRWHIGQSLPGLPAHLYDMFPDQLVESELGEIPVGWKLGAIEDLCSSISSGGTPARKKPLYWSNGTIPWFKTGELNDGPLLDADEKINEAALAGSSCKLWPAGTILFALYASPTVGRIGILTTPGTSNQAAAGLMAKDSFGIPFLRRVLIEAREKLQSVAVGAAQQNINQAILKSHQIILPASELAKEYSRIVSSWDDQQVEIAREIRSLNLLRDTLLHKLISGELRIPDAERIVGAAV